MHGRTGRHRRNRRPARKPLSDLAFLKTYITLKVQSASAMVEDVSLESVDIMFVVVAEEFQGGPLCL